MCRQKNLFPCGFLSDFFAFTSNRGISAFPRETCVPLKVSPKAMEPLHPQKLEDVRMYCLQRMLHSMANAALVCGLICGSIKVSAQAQLQSPSKGVATLAGWQEAQQQAVSGQRRPKSSRILPSAQQRLAEAPEEAVPGTAQAVQFLLPPLPVPGKRMPHRAPARSSPGSMAGSAPPIQALTHVYADFIGSEGYHPSYTVKGDFNGDGHPDVAVLQDDGSVSALLAMAREGFLLPCSRQAQTPPMQGTSIRTSFPWT